MAQDLPRENFHILLDIPRLGCREPHDDLEKVFTVCLGFGNSEWSESFEIPANTVFLFNCKPHSYQRFKKVDGVNTGHKAFILAIPVDATDADAVRCPLFGGDGSEVGMNGAAVLNAGELHQTPLCFLFLSAPAFCHGVEVTAQLQNSLGGIYRIRVEGLGLTKATGLVESRRPNQRGVR